MKRFLTKRFIGGFVKDGLSVFGVVGVVIAITEYFAQLKPVNDVLSESPLVVPVVSLIAIVWGLVKNWPKNRFEYKVNNKDIRIRLVVGDIFEQTGSLVVPINNEFDAFLGGSVERSQSIKAQVINRFFGGDREILEAKINRELEADLYKTSKTGTTYPMGTTVTVEQNQRRFYLTANSVKANPKRVEARAMDLLPTLSGMWAYLTDHAAKGEIVVPLLGTGNGRMSMPREDVFKEIVRSFIASCAAKSYCETLTIVISQHDVEKCEIDVDLLDEFLRLHCKYAMFSNGLGAPTGTAVPAS